MNRSSNNVVRPLVSKGIVALLFACWHVVGVVSCKKEEVVLLPALRSIRLPSAAAVPFDAGETNLAGINVGDVVWKVQGHSSYVDRGFRWVVVSFEVENISGAAAVSVRRVFAVDSLGSRIAPLDESDPLYPVARRSSFLEPALPHRQTRALRFVYRLSLGSTLSSLELPALSWVRGSRRIELVEPW
jgi:hypothetical protein